MKTERLVVTAEGAPRKALTLSLSRFTATHPEVAGGTLGCLIARAGLTMNEFLKAMKE